MYLKQADKFAKLKKDPGLFCRAVLGFEPFDYQRKLLFDESKRICACMGRQSGKSITIAAKAIWFASTHPNSTTLIVSVTLRQSMLMMDKIESFVHNTPSLGGSVILSKRTRARALVVERAHDKIIVRHVRTDRERNYATINAEIADYCNALGVAELCVDQTGLGNPIVEHLKELGTSVEGLVLTQKTKEELFSNLKILLEQRKIVIPNSNELLNALNCVEYERTRTGNYIFTQAGNL